MANETLKSAGQVAWMTAVGAAEGAAIGWKSGTLVTFASVGAFGPLQIPWVAANAVIGGATALTAELIGRKAKATVMVQDMSMVERMDMPRDQMGGQMMTKSATAVAEEVPLIQIPDKIASLRMQAFRDALGAWRASLSENTMVNQSKNMNLMLMPTQL